jgi:hypothetical protein
MVVSQSVLHQPFRLMIKGTKQMAATETLELSIRNQHQQYTPEFMELLKDYYL